MNRNAPRPSAALVVASLSLIVSCSGVAAAATGNLVLGAKNQASTTTTLKTSAAVKGATIKFKNAGGGPAAAFVTKAGKAPFTVRGTTKVPGLNSDLLDGLDSSAFRKTGDAVDAATLDGIDSTSFLRGDTTPKTVSVRSANAQTLASGNDGQLTANVEDYDPSDMFKVGMSDRLVANVAGTYVVTATVFWAANADGYRHFALLDKEGVTFSNVLGPASGGGADTRQNVTGIIHLAAGDFVRTEVIQNSGVDLGARLARFQMAYVGA
jgi:hypothetical protein